MSLTETGGSFSEPDAQNAQIRSSLPGRLRNLHLHAGDALLPLFEAVVNSINSIADAKLTGLSGKITIRIFREPSQPLPVVMKKKPGAPTWENIVGFEVIDNGVGFTMPNFASFLTLDSLYKANQGGKGIGRLLWLKAFDDVAVDSIYTEKPGKFNRRRFTFSEANGVTDVVEDDAVGPAETSIRLNGFRKQYRDSYAARKTPQAIAAKLLEHCLWYFLRPGGAPSIKIVDGSETIDMQAIYDSYIRSSTDRGDFNIKGHHFDVSHVKLKAGGQKEHFVALCATHRVVIEEDIRGRIPGLHGALKDDDGEFTYACYVTSKYLDDTVRAERLGFDIPLTVNELSSQTMPALSEIKAAAVESASAFLDEYLGDIKRAGRARVENYVNYRAIRYRPILNHLNESEYWIDPKMNNDELELLLHKKWFALEESVINEGQSILRFAPQETLDEYNTRIENYRSKVEDLKKSNLADYVFHRRSLLDILETAIQRNDDGTYEREDLIHQLVMPRFRTSGEVSDDDCNLWLLDERLAFHTYLGSDKEIRAMPITESDSRSRPDLYVEIIRNELYDNPMLVSNGTIPPESLVIIEFKKPMREDVGSRDEDPIIQTLEYLDLIREGKAKTARGRIVPDVKNAPGYCHIVCDITPKMEKCCKRNNLRSWRDGMFYYGYHDEYKAYIEVISFEELIKSAKQRNYAFFKKLGLPTT